MRRLIVDSDRLVALQEGGQLVLTTKEEHYLFRVLRLNNDDRLEVRDGIGGQFQARVRDDQTLELSPRTELPSLIGPRIHLAFVPVKGKRMDILLEKATELGVQEFHPLYTERSVRRDSPNNTRWARIIRSASQQCGTGHEPILHPGKSWGDWLKNNSIAQYQLIASPNAASMLQQVLPTDSPESIAFLTGPEGGFTDEEVAEMVALNWIPCQLGSLVLRAETAPLAALIILRHRFGDLG